MSTVISATADGSVPTPTTRPLNLFERVRVLFAGAHVAIERGALALEAKVDEIDADLGTIEADVETLKASSPTLLGRVTALESIVQALLVPRAVAAATTLPTPYTVTNAAPALAPPMASSTTADGIAAAGAGLAAATPGAVIGA